MNDELQSYKAYSKELENELNLTKQMLKDNKNSLGTFWSLIS